MTLYLKNYRKKLFVIASQTYFNLETDILKMLSVKIIFFTKDWSELWIYFIAGNNNTINNSKASANNNTSNRHLVVIINDSKIVLLKEIYVKEF